jgi:hypothetical protein
MTRDELIVDIERMGLPAAVTAATIALAEFQNDLPVDQTCLRCGQMFKVFGMPPDRLGRSSVAVGNRWRVACSPIGRIIIGLGILAVG